MRWHKYKSEAGGYILKYANKLTQNKKVLLRERKRHTARCVVSTPSVVLTGYPPHADLAWGVPCQGGTMLGGTLPGGTLPRGTLPGGTLPGYPPILARGVPCPGGTPPSWPGRVPPPKLDLAGYPPRCLPHGILGNVAKHYGIWVPPPRCGLTNKVKLLPSRRSTNAGGNYWLS